MRSKRAQAALEFLTTYGWAFLVILVMIGALAYFGVLNPDKFLPKRCTFGQEFRCTDSAAAKDETNGDMKFSVVLVNNKGVGVNLEEISVNDESGHTWMTSTSTAGNCTVDTSALTAANPTWKSGNAIEIECGVNGLQSFTPEGSKTKLNYVIKFKKVGGRYADQVGGELYTTVLATY